MPINNAFKTRDKYKGSNIVTQQISKYKHCGLEDNAVFRFWRKKNCISNLQFYAEQTSIKGEGRRKHLHTALSQGGTER